MRDPYLYDDVDVLKNRANIKDSDTLRKAEADITNLAMSAIYERDYHKFNIDTLCDIHRSIFGQIFDWAGEFRTIQMVKYEEVLGGDTVRYAYPKEIKKELTATMKEISKLKRTGDNDHDVVFRLVRTLRLQLRSKPLFWKLIILWIRRLYFIDAVQKAVRMVTLNFFVKCFLFSLLLGTFGATETSA